MSSNTEIRFAVIGCGDIANNAYLPLICEHAELVATCDSIAERAHNSKAAWGAQDAYTEPQDVLNRNDVDAIVISSAHDTHADLVIAASQAGKHLLIQKPLAVGMDEAHAAVSEVRRAGVKAVVEPSPQLRPVYRKAHEIVAQGVIGRPLYFIAEQAMGPPSYGEFYFRKRGGGPLYGIAIYALAALTHLFGPAKRVIGAGVKSFPHQDIVLPEIMTQSVSTEGYDQPWSSCPPKEMEVEQGACDSTFTILHFDETFFGCVASNYVTSHGPTPRGIRIFGTEGTLCIEAETPLSVLRREGTLRSSPLSVIATGKSADEFSFDDEDGPEPEIVSRSRNSLLHLIDCIHNDTDPLPTVEWGRHICEIIAASEASAEDGRARELTTTFNQ